MTDKELIKQKMLVTEANECRSEKNRVKMAHIAFSDSDMGMLKLNLYHLFRSQGLKKDYVVIPFILSLSCGNISDPPPDSNASVNNFEYRTLEQVKDFLVNAQKKLAELDDDVEIYLWKNHLFANALLNYYYFAPLFKRFSHVWVIDIYTSEQLKKRNYMPFESLEEKQVVLPKDLDAAAEEFLQHRGGDYRVLFDEKIQSFKEDYFDEMVVSCVKNTWQRSRSIISHFIDKHQKKGYVLDYRQEIIILHRLAQKRFIESNFKYGFAHDAMMIEDVSFRRVQDKKIYTADEAINILASAIECGGTARLFDVLAEDAIFIGSNNNEFKGRQAICDHIEKIAVSQCEKKISCSCLVQNGDEGQQIELIYSDIINKSIIRINFDFGKIQKIFVDC